MFEDIQCPEVAYNRIVNSELIDILISRRDKICDLLLYTDLSSTEKIFDIANFSFLNSRKKISERSEVYKEIINFEREISGDGWFIMPETFREMYAKNPSFFAYSVLGNNLFNYSSFGFPSLEKNLSESITSFCIGERFYAKHDGDWIWRNKGTKNTISQNMHGDLYAGQKDLSDKPVKIKDLFGEYETFDSTRVVDDSSGIFAYQDWSQFLYSILLYSREIGSDKISEILNWKEVLKEVGCKGTNTAECELGGSHFGLEWLLESPIFTDSKELDSFPIAIYSRESHFLPYVENGKLLYLKEAENGDIQFNNQIFEDKKYKKVLEYNENDLTDTLKANYRLFARDRSLLPIIMDYFISGKTNP